MEETVKTYYIDVRFDTTNKIAAFTTQDASIKTDDLVIVDSEYGGDYGRVVAIRDTGKTTLPIIRKATKDDLKKYEENKIDAKEALDFCALQAKLLDLDMHLVKADYTIDRTKLTFVYTSDDRVDFRELLKILAANFHCRIELRQIGARDKAKMVKGVGPCGRELCCGKFINDFDMVSINMAKNQLLALNIQKLSGHCGKLMCCLKYEDEAYKELREGLPKLNAPVEYEGENYRVTSMNVIARTCKLENKQNTIFITLDDLLKKGKFKINKKTKESEDAKTKELSK